MARPKYADNFRTCVELVLKHRWQLRSIFNLPDEIGAEFTLALV